jgi:hypothetical protein
MFHKIGSRFLRRWCSNSDKSSSGRSGSSGHTVFLFKNCVPPHQVTLVFALKTTCVSPITQGIFNTTRPGSRAPISLTPLNSTGHNNVIFREITLFVIFTSMYVSEKINKQVHLKIILMMLLYVHTYHYLTVSLQL